MGTIARLHDYTGGTKAVGAEVKEEFDQIINTLNGGIEAENLAADSVPSSKILALAVTTAKLANLAVTAPKLAANAVETDKIKDANVTREKIATGVLPVVSFKHQSAAHTTGVNDALLTGLTIDITAVQNTTLLIHCTCSSAPASGSSWGAYFSVYVDDEKEAASETRFLSRESSGGETPCSLVYVKTGINIGLHTIEIRCRTYGWASVVSFGNLVVLELR